MYGKGEKRKPLVRVRLELRQANEKYYINVFCATTAPYIYREPELIERD